VLFVIETTIYNVKRENLGIDCHVKILGLEYLVSKIKLLVTFLTWDHEDNLLKLMFTIRHRKYSLCIISAYYHIENRLRKSHKTSINPLEEDRSLIS